MWFILCFGMLVVADNTLKIPIQVDKSGKTMYFVTNSDSNVQAEALRFCLVYLPANSKDECVKNLVEQVSILREARSAAQENLPGISFSIQNAYGDIIRFTHEQGENPKDEAAAFCAEHFPDAPTVKCTQAMLENAAKALDEAIAEQQIEL